MRLGVKNQTYLGAGALDAGLSLAAGLTAAAVPAPPGGALRGAASVLFL